MANVVQISVRFASGKVGSLYNSSVTDNTTTEITTGGTGLNQTGSLSFGQAFVGETITHIGATVEGNAASAFNVCYLESGIGTVLYPIQISGGGAGQMHPVLFPIKVAVGQQVQARVSTSDATEKDACMAVICSDRTCAVFQVTAVADTKTEMTNLLSSTTTFGQTLAGKQITHAYATFTNSGGLNDDGGGNNFFYAENSAGILKGTWYTDAPVNQTGHPARWQTLPCSVDQNDSLYVMWGS